MELAVTYGVNRLLALFCAAAAACALSACSGDLFNSNFHPFGNQAGSDAGANAALEGRWVDANGIPSTFSSGIFVTRSADTNEKLSEGNYTVDSNKLVTIEVRSLVRGTVSHVNCSLNGDKLYCTNENNMKFILSRGAEG